jgi:putative addiction module component (TIGR02574 family)
MSALAQKLKTELGQLAELERAELAHFLIHSLDAPPSDVGEEEFDAELGRRAEEIRAGRASGEPAAGVFAELRARFS